MVNPENQNELIQQLIYSLESKKDSGIFPEYLWIPEKTVTSSPSLIPMKQKKGEKTLNRSEKENLLNQLRAKVAACTLCRLHSTRTQTVFGSGNPDAKILFVGEAPGKDEDLQGEPFVGRAGQLLTKIIEAMGLKREEVYIANIVKSRPPENRKPAEDEMEACSPYLFEQIRIIQPKFIVCLGNVPAQTLLMTKETITKIRGKFFDWPSATIQKTLHLEIPEDSIQLISTFHPAYLLRNPEMKKPVWEDMKLVMAELKK